MERDLCTALRFFPWPKGCLSNMSSSLSDLIMEVRKNSNYKIFSFWPQQSAISSGGQWSHSGQPEYFFGVVAAAILDFGVRV